jgi:hypothetical protein
MTETATTSPERNERVFSPDELEKFRATFAEDGYLVFRQVVEKDKLSELSAKVFAEFERQRGSTTTSTVTSKTPS